MQKDITLESTKHTYNNAVNSLNHYFESIPADNKSTIKLAHNYFQWISKKTTLIEQEDSFKIPASALPNTFSENAYNWLRPDKKIIFGKYYKFDCETKKYVICVKKENIIYEDLDMLMHSLVLTRKSVVWVEFGVNIGSEFGGRHPALILKNLDDSLIVIPLSSQQPDSDKFNVKIESVYGFPELTRWANVTRMHEIDLSRIDFTCRIGNVNSKVMTDISNKMHSCGIL